MFEKMKAAGVRLLNKIKAKTDEIAQDRDEQETLGKWKSKFQDAKGNYQEKLDLMNEREWLYLGTREVDGDVNNPVKPADGRKLANNVRNIIYELIESQVDSQIPGPVVKARKSDLEPLAQVIEESIKADLNELDIERLNDQQERTTPIQGYSFFEVFWDKTKTTHNHIGDISVRLIHPKQVVPQPGVWDIQDMDYFFVMSSVTKQYIKKRYNVDVQNESEAYPDVNSIGNESYSHAQSPKVTEIVCWYRDDDGDICRFVWCNNVVLEDLPKIFKRRLDGKIVETETLAQDIQTITGLKIPSGTSLPYFSPNTYPIVMRENVPVYYQFGGQSDVDIIRDQQNAIKKVVTKVEEKICKGGSIAVLPVSQKGKFRMTDEELKILWATPAEAAQIASINIQPDISKDVEFVEQQYNFAQSTLGITNSYQGKADSTAESAAAKRVQIAQSSGRLQSKQANKLQVYRQLFDLMFQFKLAYTDESRPYQTIDKEGNIRYAVFNRYDFIQQDSAGQYYYETDFGFDADPNNSLLSSRETLMQNALDMYKSGAINKLQLWQILVQLNFPMSEQIKKQIEQTMYLNFYDKPKISINYGDLSASAQQQLLQQIGIQAQGGVSPSEATRAVGTAVRGSPAVQSVVPQMMNAAFPQQGAPQLTPDQQQQIQQYLNNLQLGVQQPPQQQGGTQNVQQQ